MGVSGAKLQFVSVEKPDLPPPEPCLTRRELGCHSGWFVFRGKPKPQVEVQVENLNEGCYTTATTRTFITRGDAVSLRESYCVSDCVYVIRASFSFISGRQ